MNRIAIVTDSTVCMPQSLIDENELHIVPLSVIWDGKSYLDGFEISPAVFYERLQNSKTNPTTSQPSVHDFYELFKSLLDKGYDVLCIVLSSKLSGTYDMANTARLDLSESRIAVVDSQTASLPMGMVVLEVARELKQNDLSLAEAEALTYKILENTEVFFALDTLEYLHRGGRIGGAAKFLGTLIGLRPVLTIKDGKVDAVDKVRTTRRARERIIELMVEKFGESANLRFLGVTSSSVEEAAAVVSQEAEKHFVADRVVYADLSPVIGVHLGPGAIGLVCIGK